jgi:TRAP-type transport system periplasmic protein
VVLSREPIRSMADLHRLTFWRWDLDEIGLMSAREMSIHVVPLPLEDAGRAYDERKVDGFFAIPAAAVAFQWFSRALHLTALNSSYLWGCLIVSDRVFAKLTMDQQQVLRAAGAKIGLRFEEVGRQQDDALLGGLFAKQGVVPQPMSDKFRSEFFAAARAARERLADKLVPAELLQRVLALLGDYRAEHPVR